MPATSVKLPSPLSPTVDVTSANSGLSSPSTSLIVIAPVAVTAASPMSPSVTAPVVTPPTTAASSVPMIVIVTVCGVPSVAVNVIVSVAVSPASRSCAAAWFSV